MIVEPVDLATVRQRLGIVSGHRDSEIQSLITAAREQVETLSHTVIALREVVIEAECFINPQPISIKPARSIIRVTWLDENGVRIEQPSNQFRISGLFRSQKIVALPSLIPNFSGSEIQYTVTAGYGGDQSEQCPNALIQAIISLVGFWFDNSKVEGDLPTQVMTLCQPFRSMI
jgi:uncharacterized phiE125 gp8 family phage protein